MPPRLYCARVLALLGGAAVPRDRFGGILRHAGAGDIHAAEDALRLGGARLGAGTEVCEGLCGWAVCILCRNTGREGGDHEGDAQHVATHGVYSQALADGSATRRRCDGAIAGGAGERRRAPVTVRKHLCRLLMHGEDRLVHQLHRIRSLRQRRPRVMTFLPLTPSVPAVPHPRLPPVEL